MPRIIVTVTDEIYEALLALADERGTPYAHIAREYIARGLEADGKPIENKKVRWGGNRRPDKPDKLPG